MFKLKEKGISDYKSWALNVQSIGEEYDEDGKYSTLHIKLGDRYWYWKIPPIVKPMRKWVDLSTREWAKPGLDGRKGYESTIKKEYGFTIADEYIHVHYGIQPGHWEKGDRKNSDHTTLFEIPWRNTRRVRYDFLNIDHSYYTSANDRKNGSIDFDSLNKARDIVPKVTIKFKDYDGEEITATCHIEEMEWRYGTKWCKWIGSIRKPIIVRRLDMSFDKETGREKKSYKGGIIGTSTDIRPGETPLSAFIRYGSGLNYEKGHGNVNRGFTDCTVA